MRLAVAEYGAGPPLVVLHGLLGSARNWAAFARRFAARYRVIAADARNHGASPWDDDMTYPAMAADLLDLIEDMALDRPAVLGHSMGGKTAMTAALMRPDAIGALIVADIAPVAYTHGNAALVAAMRAMDLSRIARRADADAALAAVEPVQAMRDFVLQNLVIEDGRARWRVNLTALAANMDRLVGWTDPPGAAAWGGPALFVFGDRSDYVRPAHHGEIRRLFPGAQLQPLEGAGHWLHAEKPDAFASAVETFLNAAVTARPQPR